MASAIGALTALSKAGWRLVHHVYTRIWLGDLLRRRRELENRRLELENVERALTLIAKASRLIGDPVERRAFQNHVVCLVIGSLARCPRAEEHFEIDQPCSHKRRHRR
jgi:hypothetical protein